MQNTSDAEIQILQCHSGSLFSESTHTDHKMGPKFTDHALQCLVTITKTLLFLCNR